MKRGDKLICIKNFIYWQKYFSCVFFLQDSEYIVNSIDDIYVFIFNDKGDNFRFLKGCMCKPQIDGEYYIYDYFYSESEIRLKKLEKIGL